jgi:protein SCO1/2
MNRRVHNLIICIATGICLAPIAAARGQQLLDPTKQLTEQVGITPVLGTQVPLDAAFVDADGKEVRLGDFLGDRPVILHLVYYECPMLCRLSSDGVMAGVEMLLLQPGEDYSIVTLSFDPREGPELSARARNMARERIGAAPVDKGWHFLTGNEAAIAEVCRAVGFHYAWDEKTAQYAHAAGVFVFTPEGTLSRFLSGVEFSPRDLRLALVEASDNKIGTAADQVMLMCYMYDPTTGKYGLAIITAIRVAGVVTVGAMAASIFVMVRRERRSSKPSPFGRGHGEGGFVTHGTLTPTLSHGERED